MASGRLERQERADILVEVDNVAQYHYKLKFFMRINYAFAHEAVAEDEAAQWLVKGVIGETSFGELVQGDALNAAAKDADEEDSSSEENFSSEYETASDEHLAETEESDQRGTTSRPNLPSLTF